ncbi:MAG: DUF1624 domain-containing protein, partial [Desulfobacteraceae bacterium]|nr:DUF1624 domain-containing protein [Desulfobacteraceae bacterium]
VVMALDHARTFLCPPRIGLEIWRGQYAFYGGDVLAFSTRFVTHLAAPGFFFLMGASMIFFALSRKDKGWTKGQIYLFFIKRGALLVLFQFILENPAWNLGYPEGFPLYFGVLYALGASMILGVLLLEIPAIILAIVSLGLIVCTQSLVMDATTYSQIPFYFRLWLLPGFAKGTLVLYPIMPWLGVMGLGMAYARGFEKKIKQSSPGFQLSTIASGLLFLAGFFVIRATNGFGNIRLVSEEGFIGFFNVVKYPPSIAFLLLTLGTNMAILGVFSMIKNRCEIIMKPLVIFGSTPLFFYFGHLYLFAFMSILLGQGKLTIPTMYIFWILALLILLPFCIIFANTKLKSDVTSTIRLI